MDILQSTLLGIIQGMSEFLPVSSTAHLILAPYLFHWRDPGLSFDVALHIGTLVAVVSYFWRDWVVLISSAVGKVNKTEYPKHFLWFLVAATIPGALAGYFFEDIVGGALRHPLVSATTLVTFGALLYGADMWAKKKKEIRTASARDMILIGIAQALALIPGVSRSGITITAGRILGFDRIASARISFLLSTPIIFGAAANQLPSLAETGITASLLVGIIASAVSGYAAIKYLLRWISRVGYGVFFWYRLALALLIAAVYYGSASV